MTGDFIRIYDLEGMQEVSGTELFYILISIIFSVRPIKVLNEF